MTSQKADRTLMAVVLRCNVDCKGPKLSQGLLNTIVPVFTFMNKLDRGLVVIDLLKLEEVLGTNF